jgi:cell division protein FtsB
MVGTLTRERHFMKKLCIFIFALLVAGANIASAQSTQEEKTKELEERIKQLEIQIELLKSKASDAEIEELKRQVQILAEEVQKLRSGEEETPVGESELEALGLGPSAAKVYSKKQGVSIGGYGEVLYEDFANENQSGQESEEHATIDLLRAVLYFGYRFNEQFIFNSEVEYEHSGNEVSVEFAYLEYRPRDAFGIRGGNVLIPMGFLNEFHEPTVFFGARRTVTETVIIPTTWHENGVGLVGRSGIFDYRGYVINGFNAAGFSEDGLRGGRQDGAEARFDPAFTARLDIAPVGGLILGGSIYGGNSAVFASGGGEEESRIGSALQEQEPDFKVETWIVEGHTQYDWGALQLRGLYTHASLGNVTELNEFLELTGDESVGKTLQGGYFQAAYDVFANRTSTGSSSLTPFFRYERVDTQASVPSGFLKDPANDQSLWTFGIDYKPIYNVVIKADYQIIRNEADTGVNQFNIALGYNF